MNVIRIAVAAGILSLGPSLSEGQGQLLLRYDPVHDVATHTLFQTVARVATADGKVIESADLGSMRAIPLELERGGTVIHMAYDSVRARVRSGSGDWRDFAVPGADSVWMQAEVDDRLRVYATSEGPSLPPLTGLLDILTGVPGLTLPELPVRLGGAWMIDSKLSARVSALVHREVEVVPSLVFSTRVTLDSIAQRAQDTLGFFSVSGFAHPAADSDERALQAGGIGLSAELTGQLVWSRGWNGFVSGAKRVMMIITLSRPSTTPTIERTERNLTVDVTTRFQVRP